MFNLEAFISNPIPFLAGQFAPKFMGRSGFFNTTNSNRQQVPIMFCKTSLPYKETEKAQIVQIPYQNSKVTLTVVLPKLGVPVESFEMKGEGVLEFLKPGGLKKVNLCLPQFNFSVSQGLRNANFPVEAVLETAKNQMIKINSLGTTAAAATGVVAMMMEDIQEMNVDRPFVFFIHSGETVLFTGAVNSL